MVFQFTANTRSFLVFVSSKPVCCVSLPNGLNIRIRSDRMSIHRAVRTVFVWYEYPNGPEHTQGDAKVHKKLVFHHLENCLTIDVA